MERCVYVSYVDVFGFCVWINQTEWLVNWLSWLLEWLADLSAWRTGWLIGWLTERLTDGITDWLAAWLTDALIKTENHRHKYICLISLTLFRHDFTLIYKPSSILLQQIPSHQQLYYWSYQQRPWVISGMRNSWNI